MPSTHARVPLAYFDLLYNQTLEIGHYLRAAMAVCPFCAGSSVKNRTVGVPPKQLNGSVFCHEGRLSLT